MAWEMAAECRKVLKLCASSANAAAVTIGYCYRSVGVLNGGDGMGSYGST